MTRLRPTPLLPRVTNSLTIPLPSSLVVGMAHNVLSRVVLAVVDATPLGIYFPMC